MWVLLRVLGRVPRRLIWDNESGTGRGKRQYGATLPSGCSAAATLM
ncbi:Transposase [Occultella aeris]|uniref:Transposase n=1 Tax=Occultella aeris TaxID=2761496 RepID=A0A7M4DQF2_9MICO|nr:hypothetical protein HALOF300_04390 [Occultella aeris]